MRSGTEDVEDAVNRKSYAVHLGCLLLVVGVVLSGTVLEWAVLSAGSIVGTTRRIAALNFARIVLVAAGAYLVIKRPAVTVIQMCAFLPGALVAGILGTMLLQLGYTPPLLVSGWRSFAPPQEQNQLGFRGHQIAYDPDDYVILLLGDSQVESMALALDAMPERRLEAYLDVSPGKARVFSVSAGGYGQDQELLALEQYFKKHRADLVVLWQTPGNDVWNNVFNTHMYNRNPKPTFWLDGAGRLRGPSEALGQPLANSPLVVGALWQRAFGLPWRDKSWQRSLPAPYVPLSRYDGPVRTDWQERWNTNLGRMRDEDLASEKSHMAVMLVPRSKRMQYGLDLTRALTQRIHDLVTANHGALVLFQVDTHEFASDEDQMYVLNDKYYRVSPRQYRANWAYVNDGFATEVIPVRVKDWRVGPTDGHLNTQATDQVMADLAQRLRSTIAQRKPFSVATRHGA